MLESPRNLAAFRTLLVITYTRRKIDSLKGLYVAP